LRKSDWFDIEHGNGKPEAILSRKGSGERGIRIEFPRRGPWDLVAGDHNSEEQQSESIRTELRGTNKSRRLESRLPPSGGVCELVQHRSVVHSQKDLIEKERRKKTSPKNEWAGGLMS
jgi:hypothetical protein